LVAGLLGGLEQAKRLKTPITKADRAWLFWLLRLLLEVGIGVLAMLILKALDATDVEKYRPAGWIVVGAAGPTVARLRIIDVGSADDPTPFGLAAFYEPVRDAIAKQLDDIGAAALARHVKEDLLPLIHRAEVEPKDISDRYTIWMRGSDRFDKLAEYEELKFIETTLDGSQAANVQRELLVYRALDLGAHRVLRDLRRSCQ
jgi:hypothetical protein